MGQSASRHRLNMASPTSPVADSLSRSTTQSSSTGTTAQEVRTQNEQPNLDPEKQAHDQRYHHPKEKVPHWRLVASQSLITDAVANYPYNGSGTEDDPYVVEFIPNDPRNPVEFSQVKKWFITLTVAIATLTVAFVSSAYSGGANEVIATFGVSQEVYTLGISLFVLGFAIGPLLWAPLSELYGRQVLFFGTYAVLTAFNAGAAGAQNIETLIILRFFAGAFGSSPLTNAGGVIADMFPASERGLGMTVFAAAPFLGPALGPVIGGFIAENVGWRWVEGVMALY